MRIRDWSSDVCSSDLALRRLVDDKVLRQLLQLWNRLDRLAKLFLDGLELLLLALCQRSIELFLGQLAVGQLPRLALLGRVPELFGRAVVDDLAVLLRLRAAGQGLLEGERRAGGGELPGRGDEIGRAHVR